MQDQQKPSSDFTGIEIAIVGMAGRFPGAPDVDAFWRNIRDGVESVTFFSDEELRARGVPERTLADPDYVKAGVLFEGFDQFDAGFFGYSPREAEHLDPQQRIFLECAWEALEHAGRQAKKATTSVGVYAGDGPNLYLMRHLLPAFGVDAGTGIADLLGLMSGNSAGSLCTRVAYKLDLRGPAVSVQTECSTSLVAVHMACQALLSHDCDLALAGGVWLNLLQDGGYRYQQGAILSPDGHCRAFDAKAAGTVIGSGAGIVVLKRLDEALRDGDTIHAVIKGSAANNDGADKIGFTAPSVQGQASVIRAAQMVADVPASTIGYVEAHGTGTTLGDPIEMAALMQAFRSGGSEAVGHCALGSVKTNVGHLDAAAGVAGLIKAAMALRHRTLPPSLHFEQPNPQIDFANSPFYVNTEAQPWPKGDAPRRAGVSSFGIGGTNVHVVLEEAPSVAAQANAGHPPEWQVLPLSAMSATAVRQAAQRLAGHIEAHPAVALTDVAHTLQTGRRAFAHRCAVVADESQTAARMFTSGEGAITASVPELSPEVAFLFPGGGTQHANMGLALYRSDAAFRDDIDRCCELLRADLGLDLRDLLFPEPGAQTHADARLFGIALAQPALFVVEHAMAHWWMRRGVRPTIMLGHSLGEYVAACLAGVFRLEDALRVVALRGRLLQSMPSGAMTAVPLSQAELAPFLADGCDIGAANGEQLCVLSGPLDAIEAAEQKLRAQGHLPRRLQVAIASHSAMTQPLLAELEQLIASVPRQAPKIPFISNVTGQLITAEQAVSPSYWARHLRGTVQFAAGLRTLFEVPGRVALEVGPGETLAGLARQHPMAESAAGVYASQAHPQQQARNAQQIASALASLWLAGVDIDWTACHAGQPRRRVPLPTYPFQRRRYWVDASAAASLGSAHKSNSDPYYLPSWKRIEPLIPVTANAVPVTDTGCVLVLGDNRSFTGHLARHLRSLGHTVAVAESGPGFARNNRGGWTLRPGEQADHVQLLREISADLGAVTAIYHLWCLDESPPSQPQTELLECSFFSLMALVQALDTGPAIAGTLPITIVASQIADVTGGEPLCPEKATLLGIGKVIGQECPRVHCRVLDVIPPAPGSNAETLLIEQIATESATLRAEPGEPLLAYRGAHRWAKTYEPAPLPPAAQPRLRQQGVYLITGGLGGVGLAIARHLAQHWQARLVLLGRTAMPERAAWGALALADGQPEALKNKLRQLLELEALGAQVLTVSADVSDPAQLQAALALANARFGALHGIVHAAGDAGGGMLVQRTRAQVDTVFSTKVRGTRALLDAVRGQPLAFVHLCSSISSVAGGLGMSDYAAANAYLDAVAIDHARAGGCPIFSVNWDAWRGLGMAENMDVPDGIGMDGSEGARTFERIVNGPLRPQTVISTTKLSERLGPLDNGMLDMLDSDDAQPAAQSGGHPRPPLRTPYVAPEGELANALAALWTERLGIAPIGVNDNLFELGGDSLVAIQLLSRIRKAYATELHPSEFFKAPTIAGLVAHMAANGGTVRPQQSATMDISPVARTAGALPLSPMQRRLWLVDRLTDAGNAAGRAAYNMSAGLALHGELNVEALRAAIDAIIARHEVLRTVFAEDDDGEPVAVIRADVRLDTALIEIAETDLAARECRYNAVFDELVRMPFVLTEGPLIKACVVRLGEHEHVLVLVVHHIVFDGWSIAVFARELGEFYERALRGQALQLAPLPVQYVDYAAWYDRALATEAFAAKTAFWRTYLQQAPQLSSLSPDHQRPATASHAGDSVKLELSPPLSQALARLARESDTSLFTLLLSSFFLFFHQATGADDVVIGTDVAGRSHPDLEQLLGFFVNVVPLRSRIADRQADFRQWLAQTKQHTLAAMDHQDLPFDRIVEMSGAQRARDRNPLVQVLFVLQNTPEIRFSIEGVEVEVLPQQMNESKFDLAVFAREQAGRLTVEWVYATDLYRRDTVETFAASWHALLERIVATPGEAIDALAPRYTQEPVTMNTTRTAASTARMDKLGKLAKLGGAAPGREAPRAATRPVVETSFLEPGAPFPIVLQATTDDLDTVAWAKSQAGYIEMLVSKHGGILFRNFGLKTPQDFEAFAEAIEPELYGSYGDLPKKEGGKKTYRSTPYPERQMILYHNESSHLDRWPRKQWFFCELPAPVGGATPIVDCREMLRRLPADMVAEFERKELLYVRTFTPGLDVSWRDFYKTERREEVEARLAAARIDWRWLDNDTLQTRTRCPAVIRHPVTGEKVFFNQIQLHHVACLEAHVREDLLAMGGIDRMPRHVMYGDGSPISDETMAVVGRVYEECAVRFDWQQGDVVMLDNMLAAHARDPYEGPRKIVVAMGAMLDRAALDGVPQAPAYARETDELGA